MSDCPALRRLGRLIHLKEHAGGQRREDYLHLLDTAARENWDLDMDNFAVRCSKHSKKQT